jgi:single-strand DNA-binding protein
MAGSVNKVILVGNLGADPELRHTQNGDAVVNVGLATNEKWKGKDGKQNERVEWHRLTVFGKTAEIVAEYLHKGSKVYVEGQLRTREWKDKEGVQRYSTEVVVTPFGSQLVMLDPKEHREPENDKPLDHNDEQDGGRGLDDEIPFAPEVR